MPRRDDIMSLPADLPVSVDDGLARHLPGSRVAAIPLPATSGERVDLSALSGRTVVYCYPRTGRPDQEPPDGWNLIPGARGCTPQSCGFRDHFRELDALGARVFGLSTQAGDYQSEAALRLHLPFPLLSDAELAFASAMRLPTFEVQSMRLLKRLTLIVRDGVVEHVIYPVFPPDENAAQVVQWLTAHPMSGLPDLGEQLRPFIEALPLALQPRLLARLERGAAERYRAWAASCPDPQQADGLRACAAREEEVAERAENVFPPQPGEQQRIGEILPEVARVYRSALDQRPVVQQYAIQAASERRGASLWRALASSLFASDASVHATLLVCADLEEQSARFLDTLGR